MIRFDLEPIGKPRMTQRDKWKKRDVVVRYYAFKDALNLLARSKRYSLGESLRIIFYIPMSASWSKKKKSLMIGTKHKLKPDIDNLIKAFTDCLAGDVGDAGIYHVEAYKYWSDKGEIIVLEENEEHINSVWLTHNNAAILPS